MSTARNIPLDRGYAILLTDLGLNPSEILASIGLPEQWAYDDDVYISLKEYYRLWTAIDQASPSKALPVTLAEAITLETLDPPIFAALYCQNFITAVKRIVDYKKLIAPIVIETSETETAFSITIDWPQLDAPIPSILFTSVLTYFTQLLRIATRTRLAPLAVEYRQKLPELDTFTEFFGVKPKRGNSYRIQFDVETAKAPFITASRSMWGFFEPKLRLKLFKMEAATSAEDSVRAALFECLPAGINSLEGIANKLNIPKRSLQRQLSESNLTFKQILNETRQTLAQYYLEHTAYKNTEIAFLIGFKEPNSFIRAFKQWTGLSPLKSKSPAREVSLNKQELHNIPYHRTRKVQPTEA